MFNRLKGAIDYVDQRFQEEQARARAAQGQTARSNSNARRTDARGPAAPSRNASIDRRPKDGPARNPDPNEFDPDLVIGDESELSLTNTPAPAKDTDASVEASVAGSGETTEGGKQSELPQDVRTKLRKLERLEFKYQELLRSYRIAHARVSAIEPFEAALRENTPLTSIGDPSALTEYLTQVNLKGDMVLDELKRVSAEKDTFRQRLEEAEAQTSKAWDEVAQLKSKSSMDVGRAENETKDKSGHESNLEAPAKTGAVSEKVKASTNTGDKDSADLFSYDDELPRVENELRQSQEEVQRLQGKVRTLKDDLESATDSTESMSRDLEEVTRELNNLRDFRKDAKAESDRLMAELEAADARYRKIEHEKQISDSADNEDNQARLRRLEGEIEELRRLNAESQKKNSQIDKLESELETAHQDLQKEKANNEVRASTAGKLIDTLREELTETRERVHTVSLRNEKMEKTLEDLEQRNIAPELEDTRPLDKDEPEKVEKDSAQGEVENTESGKKSKKKKRKAGKAATSEIPKPSLAAGDEINTLPIARSSTQLKEQLEKALTEAKKKDAAISRLESSSKIKLIDKRKSIFYATTLLIKVKNSSMPRRKSKSCKWKRMA